MTAYLRSASVWALVLLVTTAKGQPPARPMLDLLPSDEFGALLIRDTAEFARRGDELIDAAGVPMEQRPSYWIGIALRWLGVEKSFDDREPVGVIVAGHDGKASDVESIVVAVPYRDRQQAIADSRLTGEAGTVEDLQPTGQLGSDFWMCGAMDDSHIYLGGGRKREVGRAAVQSVLSGPRLSPTLAPQVRERLNDADVLLHFGAAEVLARQPDADARDYFSVRARGLDPDEREVADEFARAAEELKHMFFTLRLDDGLSAHSRLHFATGPDSASARLLGELVGRRGAAMQPSLSGLPEGPVIAAGAARLPGARQQLVLRTLARLVAPDAGSVGTNWFVNWEGGAFTDVRQALLLGALVDVLPLTRELRFAVYPNPDEMVATIVILDADDPDKVVANIRELADLLAAGPAPAATADTKATETASGLRKLIRELGADDFAVRSRASTRLLLLGEPARPALMQAAESEDAEIAARAKSLLAKFESSRHIRDERLLEDNPLVGAHPRLTYHVAAETIGTLSIDVIRLELLADEAPRAKQLADLFGPEWDRVRIARLPGHVVIAFGAPGPRWPAALDNLQHGRAGLEFDPRLVRLPDDPDRLIEVHFPLSRMVAEGPGRHWNTGPARDAGPSRALTAVALSATDSELTFDLHLPVDEARVLAMKRGWFW